MHPISITGEERGYVAMTAPSSQSEEALARRVQQGDDGAFDRLVELCAPRIYNLAYRLLSDPEDARDAAQDVFIRVYQALPAFKWDAAFSTWLYRIATNVCYDELKRRRRYPLAFSELSEPGEDDSTLDHAASSDTTEELLLRREQQRTLEEAIATLPEHFRLVLVLYDLQGLSYQEIAEILRQNLGTVKSRLNRARHLLREKLATQRELFRLRESRNT